MEGQDILYEVKDKVTIITFNLPKKLNALTGPQYLLLGKLIERANEEPETVITLLQGTGRFFSAGANVGLPDDESAKKDPHKFWLENFVSRNVYLTDLFHNHTKVLVSALNGPVIGLTAALVAHSDLIYVNDETKTFLLAPFANLGLVAEGAASATLFNRLGWSTSSEALLFSKPIPGTKLNQLGFFNKTYTGQNLTTEEFNKQVLEELVKSYGGLLEESILQNKQLLKANRDDLINSANGKEAIQGFHKWVQGIPQKRFAQMKNKERKHKM